MNNDDCYFLFENNMKKFLEYFSYFKPKYNTIILEGKICMKVTGYITKTDNLFSNRFNAFWYYISHNNLNNKSIYSLKEYANSSNIYDDYGDIKKDAKSNDYDNSYDDDENITKTYLL